MPTYSTICRLYGYIEQLSKIIKSMHDFEVDICVIFTITIGFVYTGDIRTKYRLQENSILTEKYTAV